MPATPPQSSLGQFGLGAVVLAGIAALFGLRLATNGSRSAQPKTDEPSAAAGAAALRAEPEPHKRFLADSFRITPLSGEVAAGTDDNLLIKHADDILVLIATVPDPVDTPFGFWYDELIESLTRAVCDAGYVPAGHWTPWEQYRFGQAVSERDSRTGRAKSDAENRAALEPLFERYPGVLRFRNKDKPERVLAVLLVGETPNAIRSAALARALDVVAAVQLQDREPDRTVRLIAPYFTGAQPSLQRTLLEWRTNQALQVFGSTAGLMAFPHGAAPLTAAATICTRKIPPGPIQFDIISGAANGLKALPKDLEKAGDRLRATTIPSAILQNAAVHFLKDGRVNRKQSVSSEPDFDRVAFLVESNTGFGRSQTEKAKGPWPLYLPYPMHLSWVSAQYTRERLEREKRLGLAAPGLSAGTGRVPDRPNPDIILPLDATTTPPLQDRAVDDITAAIRRERVRYVGILATDAQDRAFLVGRIKDDCPGVDIFIPNMDHTFALPENRRNMRGVLISATYPLYPPNQGWTRPDDYQRHTFQSQPAQAYFNAALIHLASAKDVPASQSQVKDASQNRKANKWVREYWPPPFSWDEDDRVGSEKPPVWIMTISDNGRVVPHGFYDKYDSDEVPMVRVSHDSKKDMLQRSSPPDTSGVDWPPLGPFRSTTTLATLAICAGVWWLLRDARRFSSSKSDPSLTRRQRLKAWCLRPMEPVEQKAGVYQHLAFAALAVAAIVMLETILILALEPAFRKYPVRTLVCLWAVAALLIGLLLVIVLFQVRLVYRLYKAVKGDERRVFALALNVGLLLAEHARKRSRLAINVGLLLGVAAFGLGLALGCVFWRDSADRILFVERRVAVQTGYSILPPALLLAVGFFSWAYFALRLDDLGRRFRIECPYPAGDDPKASDPPVVRTCRTINRLDSELHSELTDFATFCLLRRRRVLITLGLFLPAAVLVVIFRCRDIWEGLTWNVFFAFGFIGLMGLGLVTIMWFLDGWKRLEVILKQITLVPMVHAFDRMPRKVAGLFVGYFMTRRPRSEHLVIPLHILRQLQHEAASAPPATQTAAQTVSSRMPSYEDLPIAIAQRLSSTAAWPTFDCAPAAAPLVHAVTTGTPAASPGGTAVMTGTPAASPGGTAVTTSTPGAAPGDKAAESADTSRADEDYPGDWVKKISSEAQNLITQLRSYWPRHSVADAFGDETEPMDGDKKAARPTAGTGVPDWVRTAEDFVAIQSIIFVSQFFILLRKIAAGLVWALLLLLLAATSYPFQPERLILYVVLGLLGAGCGAILWVMIRVNKNELMSRITQSTPNHFQLDWTFAWGVVQYLGPVALVLAAHASGGLRTIVEPLLDVVR